MKKILCIVCSATLIFVMSCQREQDVFENTTLSVGGQNQTGVLSYSIKVQTQDEIIRNWKIGRSAFYGANPNNQGHGVFNQVGNLSGGPWAAWDGEVSGCNGANVSFVLPTVTQ